jgi:dTDP-4-amino-4,6-dideoxygalactose transaminase
MTFPIKIKLLTPDLPSPDELLPWLRRIDSTRCYTNSGPLALELAALLSAAWPMSSAQDEALQVVPLSSGTASLELGIAALHLCAGGTALLPAFTFPATATAVLRNGLQPVFADVDVNSWQLTPAMARAIAKQQTLALVIPVATFGCPVNTAEWDLFVEDTGIPVLVDAAGAFGNQAIGKRVHFSFSLHATKPLGIGEGGLFVTYAQDIADRVSALSNFGLCQGQVLSVGTNAKLSEYAAAIALAQWSRWPAMQLKRLEKWNIYYEWLKTLPNVTMQSGVGRSIVPANVVLRLSYPCDYLVDSLKRAGIETRQWYCPPLYQHAIFALCSSIQDQYGNTALPITKQLAIQTLGLPWHNFLDHDDFEFIKEALTLALAGALSVEV